MVTPIDTNLLLGFYQARAGLTSAGASLSSIASKKVAPTAPWNRTTADADISAAVKVALQGRKFINENGPKLDLPGANADYRKLFALYSGLSTLMGVAEQSGAKLISDADRARISRAFERGLQEINDYVADVDLEKVRVIQGTASTSAKTKLGVPRNKTEYVTPPLVSGSSANEVPAFVGDVQFTMSIKRSGAIINVPIDLAAMGAQTRSLVNVVGYMNQQLQAAGVDARVASQRIAGGPKYV